jgi:TRAP-type C4-dicarboxylate transport system permease small subunit
MALKKDMPSTAEASSSPLEKNMPDDGARQLLISGAWILVIGFLAVALTKFAFGGIGPQGAHSNAGWIALIVALMCLPFGFLLFLLGAAKWLRNKTQEK